MGSGFEISLGESTIPDSSEGITRLFAQMQRAQLRSLFVFLVHTVILGLLANQEASEGW